MSCTEPASEATCHVHFRATSALLWIWIMATAMPFTSFHTSLAHISLSSTFFSHQEPNTVNRGHSPCEHPDILRDPESFHISESVDAQGRRTPVLGGSCNSETGTLKRDLIRCELWLQVLFCSSHSGSKEHGISNSSCHQHPSLLFLS
jgi:hypothetical protein